MRTMFEVYCPKCGKEVAVDDTLLFDCKGLEENENI